MCVCVCVEREQKRKKEEGGVPGGGIIEKLSGRPTPARLPTSPPLHSASWDRPPNELLAPKSLFQALLCGEFKHQSHPFSMSSAQAAANSGGNLFL